MEQIEQSQFTCPECGGDVAPRTGDGRLYEFRRGVPALPLPAELVVPECADCHELFIPEALIPQLESAMREPYIKWQAEHLGKVTALLSERHRLTKAQIARLAGITPSHLSHILAGEKDVASETLLRLLEAFAKCSAEVERHKSGVAFDVTAAATSAWSPPQAPPSPPKALQAATIKRFARSPASSVVVGYKMSEPRTPPSARRKPMELLRHVS